MKQLVLDGFRFGGEARQNARKEMSPKTEQQLTARRTSTTRAPFELVIAEAVRGSSPECSALIGVIVERVVPGAPGSANWVVEGVKYGKAQRDRCRAAISVCVADGQREFEVSD